MQVSLSTRNCAGLMPPREMPLTVMGSGPVLVNVKVKGSRAGAHCWSPKSLAGRAQRGARRVAPVPVSEDVSEGPGTFEATIRSAVLAAPVAGGTEDHVDRAVTADRDRGGVQVSLSTRNCAGLVPPMEMPLTVMGSGPVLVNVKGTGSRAVSHGLVPEVVAGRAQRGARRCTPVPVSEDVSEGPGTFEATIRSADLAPALVGGRPR